jgi:hypothetical protein
MISSGEEDVGDGESRRKRVCHPHHFWVHDEKHGNVIKKASIDTLTVYALVLITDAGKCVATVLHKK